MKKYQLILGTLFLWGSISQAGTVSTSVYTTSKNGKTGIPVGQIFFTDGPYGLIIKPELNGLTPGLHGLHLHEHGHCGDMGNHAGGHFDPLKTNTHKGPYGNGHLGDLPALYVDEAGKANLITLAPRLKTSELKGLTVMIHAGGDNYTDTPPLGGGGARMACGILNNIM